MRGHWRFIGGALVIALSLASGPLEAQRGFGGRGRGFQDPAGPNVGSSVSVAIEHQEELELSGEQVAQLQEMEYLLEGDIAGLTEEMNAMREGILAGEFDREDGLRQMGALRGELITASAPLRGRVQEILTVEQHNKLQPLVWQGRPGGMRGRAAPGGRGASASTRGGGALRGQAGRPGVQRGLRGGGVGVAARPMVRGRAQAPMARGQARGMRPGRASRFPAYPRRGVGGYPTANSGLDWNLR